MMGVRTVPVHCRYSTVLVPRPRACTGVRTYCTQQRFCRDGSFAWMRFALFADLTRPSEILEFMDIKTEFDGVTVSINNFEFI